MHVVMSTSKDYKIETHECLATQFKVDKTYFNPTSNASNNQGIKPFFQINYLSSKQRV